MSMDQSLSRLTTSIADLESHIRSAGSEHFLEGTPFEVERYRQALALMMEIKDKVESLCELLDVAAVCKPAPAQEEAEQVKDTLTNPEGLEVTACDPIILFEKLIATQCSGATVYWRNPRSAKLAEIRLAGSNTITAKIREFHQRQTKKSQWWWTLGKPDFDTDVIALHAVGPSSLENWFCIPTTWLRKRKQQLGDHNGSPGKHLLISLEEGSYVLLHKAGGLSENMEVYRNNVVAVTAAATKV